jgi:hypothetical protein
VKEEDKILDDSVPDSENLLETSQKEINQEEKKTAQPCQTRTWKIVVLTILLNAAVTAGMLCFYHHNYTWKFQVADVRKFENDMRTQFLMGKINEEKAREMVDSYKHKLESAEKDPHMLVLLKEVVVRGRLKEIKP